MGSTRLISSAFTALLNCAEVGRRNRILTNYRFLSQPLLDVDKLSFYIKQLDDFQKMTFIFSHFSHLGKLLKLLCLQSESFFYSTRIETSGVGLYGEVCSFIPFSKLGDVASTWIFSKVKGWVSRKRWAWSMRRGALSGL